MISVLGVDVVVLVSFLSPCLLVPCPFVLFSFGLLSLHSVWFTLLSLMYLSLFSSFLPRGVPVSVFTLDTSIC